MRSCRERLTEQVAERTAAGGGGVYFFIGGGGGFGGCLKRRRGAPTAAGSAGGVASCCRGRWCVLTTGGIEPPILAYEPILLTTGPIQASCAISHARRYWVCVWWCSGVWVTQRIPIVCRHTHTRKRRGLEGLSRDGSNAAQQCNVFAPGGGVALRLKFRGNLSVSVSVSVPNSVVCEPVH